MQRFLLLTGITIVHGRSILESHRNPSDVKHFEAKLDSNVGYWSPSTSSIDWCERNYVVTKYVAEFWNTISSLSMCLLSAILIVQGLYNGIEKRFLLLSFSFGVVGLGSAYFHGTLTHFGQMTDELPMVYSMIIWWFILFRMNREKRRDFFVLLGILYAFFWSYIHSLQTFVLIFQAHFTLMILGGMTRLIFLYQHTPYHTRSIRYFIVAYITLILVATICWIIDQQLCEKMNSPFGFNPQLHAWWHLISAIDCYVGIVCAESMRVLSIKYRDYLKMNVDETSNAQVFQSKEHLHIVFRFGLPFVDYSKDKPLIQTKNK